MAFVFAVLPILFVIVVFLLVVADDKKKQQKINIEKKERELSSYKLAFEAQKREDAERLAKINKTNEIIEKSIDLLRKVSDKYGSFAWYKGGENTEIQGVVKGVKTTLYIEKKSNNLKYAKHDDVSIFVRTEDSVVSFGADHELSLFHHLEKVNDKQYIDSLLDGDDPRDDYFI